MKDKNDETLMEKAIALFVANIPAMTVIGIAAILANADFSGWGWFLFAGICLIHIVHKSKDDEDDS